MSSITRNSIQTEATIIALKERIEQLEINYALERADHQRTQKELAEPQAREAQMREALKMWQECSMAEPGVSACARATEEALSLPTDDTTLRQAIAKELRSMAETFESEHEWVSKVAISAQMRNRADELENGK